MTVSSNCRCNICCITFRTHRGLLRHNAVIHKQLPTDPSGRPFIQNNPSIPLGFGDLAFIDFSCQKFPQIAQVKTCKIQQMRKNYFIYLFYFFWKTTDHHFDLFYLFRSGVRAICADALASSINLFVRSATRPSLFSSLWISTNSHINVAQTPALNLRNKTIMLLRMHPKSAPIPWIPRRSMN